MTNLGHYVLAGGRPYQAPPGVAVRNWTSVGSGVRRLSGTARPGRVVDMLVCHESTDDTWKSTQRILAARKLSVHLMVTPDLVDGFPLVTQHADLLTRRCVHAGSQNGPSIAIEYVSPYYPESTPPTFPPGQVLEDVGWADDGRDRRRNYQMLPAYMLETGAKLIEWLTMPEGPIGTIPRTWIGHDRDTGRFALYRVPGNPRRPGIWAHAYTAHADAAVPVLYAWLRIDQGLDPVSAYERTIQLASTPSRWAQLLD